MDILDPRRFGKVKALFLAFLFGGLTFLCRDCMNSCGGAFLLFTLYYLAIFGYKWLRDANAAALATMPVEAQEPTPQPKQNGNQLFLPKRGPNE